MAALTDYMENKLIDWLFRGQSFTPPATLYIGLLTVVPTDSTAGTEVTGGSYARVGVAGSLANWAGTQSAGSTTASSGTGGTTSNNGAVTFPSPTGSWGSVVAFGFYDASSGGNLLALRSDDGQDGEQRRRGAQFRAGCAHVPDRQLIPNHLKRSLPMKRLFSFILAALIAATAFAAPSDVLLFSLPAPTTKTGRPAIRTSMRSCPRSCPRTTTARGSSTSTRFSRTRA
jgi:hypothetical protein